MSESYWNKESDPYLYLDSPVLKNLPDIRDADALEVFESRATALRMDEVIGAVITTPITFALWRDIHRTLLQDVYEWAGEIRSVQLAKGDTVFAMPQHIEAAASRIFDEFSGENFGVLDRAHYVSRLAYYFGELNVLHPFREGNGRTQKLLFKEITRRHGYILDWSRIEVDALLRALIMAYRKQDYTFIEALFREALTDSLSR